MPRRLVARLAVVVAVGWAALTGRPGAAAAQIVNVQSLIGDDAEEGVSGSVDASVDWRTGNTDLILVRGAATVRYRHGDHLVFGIVRGELGKSGEPLTRFVSKTFEHVRYRYTVTPRLTAEAFAQNEADAFRRLRIRALVGAGPRFGLVQRPRYGLHVGVAAMLEYEQLTLDGEVDAGATQTVGRFSSHLVGRVEIDDRLTGSETVYVQPRMDQPSDVRVLGETALLVSLSKHASLKLALVIAHDSRPPPETESTDTSLQTGVSVTF